MRWPIEKKKEMKGGGCSSQQVKLAGSWERRAKGDSAREGASSR